MTKVDPYKSKSKTCRGYVFDYVFFNRYTDNALQYPRLLSVQRIPV